MRKIFTLALLTIFLSLVVFATFYRGNTPKPLIKKVLVTGLYDQWTDDNRERFKDAPPWTFGVKALVNDSAVLCAITKEDYLKDTFPRIMFFKDNAYVDIPLVSDQAK